MPQHVRYVPAILITVMVLGAHSRPVYAQDPVVKPQPASEPTGRLPAPTPVTARQLPNGTIEVRWPAVEGAIRYDLWRSVPPAGQTAVTRANPSENTYVDADVKAGSTYYYLVAAVNSAGISGLRAGAPPVLAVAPTGGTTPVTQPISARLVGPRVVEVSYPAASAATGYRIERVSFRPMSTNAAQMDPSSPQTSVLTTTRDLTFRDTLATQPVSQWVQYRVTPLLAIGTASTMTSPIVMVPAAATTTGGSTADTVGGPSAGFGGATTLTVLPPVPLRVGASTALAGPAGVSGAKWVSLNESVARVDASGTVTGTAAGTTQVVALASSADGSARVVAVPVTVAP